MNEQSEATRMNGTCPSACSADDAELTPSIIHRLINAAFAFQDPPKDCRKCGWPTGGRGKYKCLCVTQGVPPNAEGHGRRSRTVQPLVGSLDSGKE